MKLLTVMFKSVKEFFFGESPIVYGDNEKVGEIIITISSHQHDGKRKFFYDVQESYYGALSYQFNSAEDLIARITSKGHKKFLLNAIKNNLK